MNLKFLTKIFILFAFFLIAETLGQNNPNKFDDNNSENLFKKYQAKIILHKDDNSMEIKGMFLNKSSEPIKINYTLSSNKKGKSGNSSSSQSGAFDVKMNSEIGLSKSIINTDEKDNLKIILKVFKDDSIIAQDSLMIIGSEIADK